MSKELFGILRYYDLVDIAIATFLFGSGFLAFMIGLAIALETLGIVVI